MLSILGATQDDIEEILKGLGYRGGYRAGRGSPDPYCQSRCGAARNSHTGRLRSGGRGCGLPHGGGSSAQARYRRPRMLSARSPRLRLTPRRKLAWMLAKPRTPAEEVRPSEMAADASGDSPPASEPAAGGEEAKVDVTPEAGANEAAAPAEESEAPRPVLLWRPGGRQDGAAARTSPCGRRSRRRSRPARPRQSFRRQAGGRGRCRSRGAALARVHRGKPHHGKGGPGKGGFGKGGPGGRGAPDRSAASHDGGRNDRPVRKEKPIDPDSPFAALAALRDKLKK